MASDLNRDEILRRAREEADGSIDAVIEIAYAEGRRAALAGAEQATTDARQRLSYVCEGCGGAVVWYVDDTGQTRQWRHVDRADSYDVGAHRPVVVAAHRLGWAAPLPDGIRACIDDAISTLEDYVDNSDGITGTEVAYDVAKTLREALAADVPAAADHGHPGGYLSTACLHGLCEPECGAAQRARGDLSAPHCKYCPAPCTHSCHTGGQVERAERVHADGCTLAADEPHHTGWCALPDGDVPAAGEAEVAEHRCPACGSTSWVSVSLDEGWTRRAQCVPCGKVHALLGPGWRQELVNGAVFNASGSGEPTKAGGQP